MQTYLKIYKKTYYTPLPIRKKREKFIKICLQKTTWEIFSDKKANSLCFSTLFFPYCFKLFFILYFVLCSSHLSLRRYSSHFSNKLRKQRVKYVQNLKKSITKSPTKFQSHSHIFSSWRFVTGLYFWLTLTIIRICFFKILLNSNCPFDTCHFYLAQTAVLCHAIEYFSHCVN